MNLDFEQSLSIVVEFRVSSETHKDKGTAPAYPLSTSLLRMITRGVKIVRHSTHWCHWWKSWIDSIKVDLGMHRAIAHWKAILFGNHSIKSLQRVAFPVHNGEEKFLRHLAMVGKFLDDTRRKVNLLCFYFLDLIHFICQMLAKRTVFKLKRKFLYFVVFTYSITRSREIRKFHVAQRRVRNVQERDARAN